MRLRMPALLLALSLLLSACGGEDAGSPTEPDEPTSQVATVEVSPDRAVFQRDSVVDFDAVAEDQQGNRLSGVDFNWSVDDPDVATVNDTGLVRGLASGKASVTAEAEGEQGSSRFRVRAGRTVVIDSTQLELVSDSAERAQGTLRFAIREPPAPDVEAGDILVGAERGGFLRRVTEVSASESELTAETEPASLSEAVTEPASFSTSVSFKPGSQTGRVERGGVVWGPIYTRRSARGVTVRSGALEIEDLTLIDGEICRQSGSGCVSAQITLDSGRVAFTPEMDVAAEFGPLGGLERFRAVGTGKLEFDAAATGSATGSFQKSGKKELHQFGRTFWTTLPTTPPIPVQGEVRLTFIAGYEAGAEATYSVHTGFNSSLGTDIGAEYDGNNWSTVFSVRDSFEALPVRRDLKGKAHAKVFVEPEFSVVFYTVAGPTASPVPFLKGEATFDPDEACTFKVSSGMDGILGFDVEVLGDEVASYSDTTSIATTTLLAQNLGCTGDIRVVSETRGPASKSAYEVSLNGDTTAEVSTNDSLLFESLAVGDHQLTMGDVGEDCTLDGPHSRTVSLGPSDTARARYSVGCDVAGWRAVSAGMLHNCGVTVEDRLYCWGFAPRTGTDSRSQREDEHVPAAVQLDEPIKKVSSGENHTCALTTEGKAYCWGANEDGRLGDGTTDFRQLPVPVDTDLRFAQITAGDEHTCALTDDGDAYCWGEGADCQLGKGTREDCGDVENELTPVKVRTDQTFSEIRAGDFGNVAITANGEGVCWGQTCDWRSGEFGVPREMPFEKRWLTLDADQGVICGVGTGNDAYCVGGEFESDSLRLGTGEGVFETDTLVQVAGGHEFRAVRVGHYHNCGVTTDGIGLCWGDNLDGQLGDGTTDTRDVPVRVAGGLTFEAIEAGVGSSSRHTCGVTTDGVAFCWGSDRDGKLGDGNPENEADKHDHTTPMKVSSPGGG